jgi:hypothetical protein
MIQQHLDPEKEARIGRLFLVVRRRGYAYGYKTFVRDVAELGIRGKEKTRVEYGGAKGNTTLVSLNVAAKQ